MRLTPDPTPEPETTDDLCATIGHYVMVGVCVRCGKETR